MDQLVAAMGPTDNYLPACDPTDAGVRHVIVRSMIQIPHVYLGLVIGRRLTPKMLWSDLVGAILPL